MFALRPPLQLIVLLGATALVTGCISLGRGITERAWRAAWTDLKPGLTASEVRQDLGEPWKILPARATTAPTETWIYTRPEQITTHTVRTGEHDITLPNGRLLSVPDYEDKPVIVQVEYRLTWADGILQHFQRVEPGRGKNSEL